MFASIKARFQDTKTIARLCEEAELSARADGRVKPGSEHFVLAALRLPDDTARHAFRSLGLTANSFSKAIATQFVDALAAVGVVVQRSAQDDTTSPARVAPIPNLYEAEPSGQALVQRIAATRDSRKGRCLMSADVLLASAQEQHTTTSRAFASLGVTRLQLIEVANEAMAAKRSAASDA